MSCQEYPIEKDPNYIRDNCETSIDFGEPGPLYSPQGSLPFRMFLFGPSGSGKSSRCATMLSSATSFDKVGYHQCFWIGNSGFGQEYMDYLRSSCCVKFIDYATATAWTPKLWMETLKATGVHSIMIFDDPGVADTTIQNFIVTCFSTLRHGNCSMIMLSQSYSYPWMRSVRKNCNIISFTKGTTKMDLKYLQSNTHYPLKEFAYASVNQHCCDDSGYCKVFMETKDVMDKDRAYVEAMMAMGKIIGTATEISSCDGLDSSEDEN